MIGVRMPFLPARGVTGVDADALLLNPALLVAMSVHR